jgi:hypothetical protein
MNRIEGWCIVEKATGMRFGGLYESEGGAKASWWQMAKRDWYMPSDMRHLAGKKFDQQDEYILQPLVLLEGKD